MKKMYSVVLVSLIVSPFTLYAGSLFSSTNRIDIALQRLDAQERKINELTQQINKIIQNFVPIQNRIVQLEKSNGSTYESGYQVSGPSRSSYADPVDESISRLISVFTPRTEQEVDKFRSVAGNMVSGFSRAIDSLTPPEGRTRTFRQ